MSFAFYCIWAALAKSEIVVACFSFDVVPSIYCRGRDTHAAACDCLAFNDVFGYNDLGKMTRMVLGSAHKRAAIMMC